MILQPTSYIFDWKHKAKRASKYIRTRPLVLFEVMPPQGTQFLLATNIPRCEHHILALKFLTIETCIWFVGKPENVFKATKGNTTKQRRIWSQEEIARQGSTSLYKKNSLIWLMVSEVRTRHHKISIVSCDQLMAEDKPGIRSYL